VLVVSFIYTRKSFLVEQTKSVCLTPLQLPMPQNMWKALLSTKGYRLKLKLQSLSRVGPSQIKTCHSSTSQSKRKTAKDTKSPFTPTPRPARASVAGTTGLSLWNRGTSPSPFHRGETEVLRQNLQGHK